MKVTKRLKVMSDAEVVARVEVAMRQLLSLQSALRILSFSRRDSHGSRRWREVEPDIAVEVSAPDDKRYEFLIEARSSGEPRVARLAAARLRALVAASRASGRSRYGVFVAPYISENTRRVCRDEHIGFIDLCGNCLLTVDGAYISMEGRPNLFRTGRGLKSLFTPKAGRCVRVVLTDTGREWRVSDLAAEAKVSMGQASHVKTLLLDAELASESGKGPGRRFRLAKPEELLLEWSKNYSYTRNSPTEYYAFEETRALERRLAAYCRGNNLDYAFTITSGAALIAPMPRYDTAFAYVSGRQDELQSALGLKPVSGDANLVFLEPYDEGVFFGVRELGSDLCPADPAAPAGRVVSDIQLFLDLKSYGGRGEVAADFLLEQRLRPTWRQLVDSARQ
ncbi:MAG TPA: hypothetical protein VMH22_12400 [bacterium]|nr:hypothetical protein [bacterium]